MGANLLIVATSLSPQTFPQDTAITSTAHGFAYQRLRFDLAFALLLSLSLACDGSGSSKTQGGRFEARWAGSDTGQISAPAAAEWCDGQRRLEIRAIAGDTGVALAIYPNVILSPDTYPVAGPARSDSVAPSARVGLRWFGATAIKGFQGDSGAVVLERTDSGQLSGNVGVRARSVSNNDRVTVTGEFRNLTVVDQVRGCIPESPPDSMEQVIEPGDIDDVD
jgi:hypothetical protein